MKKLITVLIIVIVVGALGYLGTQSKSKFEHHSLLEEIHHGENFHGHLQDSLDAHHDIGNDLVDTTNFLKIHSKDPKLKSIFSQLRTHDIASFPCQNCHDTALDKLKFGNETDIKNAHWDIELKHAKASVMTCNTCHNSNNLNSLISLTGDPISIDRSYDMCGQCHSTQYKDWLGGAHGKSLSGWRQPRVIKTCVGCHNPHDPSIKSRWPSRLVK
jgi:hypothetical protein